MVAENDVSPVVTKTTAIVTLVTICILWLAIAILIAASLSVFTRERAATQNARDALGAQRAFYVAPWQAPAASPPLLHGLRARVVADHTLPVELQLQVEADGTHVLIRARWLFRDQSLAPRAGVRVVLEHAADGFRACDAQRLRLVPGTSGERVPLPLAWQLFPQPQTRPPIARHVHVLAPSLRLDAEEHRAVQSHREYNPHTNTSLYVEPGAAETQLGSVAHKAYRALWDAGEHEGARLLLALQLLDRYGGLVTLATTRCQESLWQGPRGHLLGAHALVVVRASPTMKLQHLSPRWIAARRATSAVRTMLDWVVKRAPARQDLGLMLNCVAGRAADTPHVLGATRYGKEPVLVLESSFEGHISDRTGKPLAKLRQR